MRPPTYDKVFLPRLPFKRLDDELQEMAPLTEDHGKGQHGGAKRQE